MEISDLETISDESSGNPALLESWILEVICSSWIWGHRFLVGASSHFRFSGSGRFSLVGSVMQHVNKYCTGVCQHGRVLWSISNCSATFVDIVVTLMDSRALGKKDYIPALSTFLIDEHCLINSKEAVVVIGNTRFIKF